MSESAQKENQVEEEKVSVETEGHKMLHKKWCEILDRKDCSYNMFCEDIELLLEMAYVLDNHEECEDVLEVIPHQLLEDVYVNATKCFTEEKFDSFIRERLNRFGSRKVVPVKFDSKFQTLMNKAKNDIRSLSYAKLVTDLMSKMSCSPGETLLYLVTSGLVIPTFLPIVAHMLSKTFRPVCLFRDDQYVHSLLTSMIKNKTSVKKVDIKGVMNMIKEVNKSKFKRYGSSVLDLEMIVMSWTDTIKVSQVLNKQFELLNQLLVSNVVGKDPWSKLNIPRFVLWLYSAMHLNAHHPEKKEYLIDTFTLVMNNHVQRRITLEEFELIKELSGEELDRETVLNFYLLPFLDEDASKNLRSNSWNTPEVLMMVAICGDEVDSGTLFNDDSVESLGLICPMLTKRETGRLFDYLSEAATIDVVVSFWAIAFFFAQEKTNSLYGAIENFVQVVKEKWGLEEDHDSDSGDYSLDADQRWIAIEALEELAHEIRDTQDEETCQLVRDLISWIDDK